MLAEALSQVSLLLVMKPCLFIVCFRSSCWSGKTPWEGCVVDSTNTHTPTHIDTQQSYGSRLKTHLYTLYVKNICLCTDSCSFTWANSNLKVTRTHNINKTNCSISIKLQEGKSRESLNNLSHEITLNGKWSALIQHQPCQCCTSCITTLLTSRTLVFFWKCLLHSVKL